MSRKTALTAEGFTLKSFAKNAVVVGPPNAGAFQERPARPTTFRKHCDSGNIPVALTHNNRGNGIMWKVDFEMLDYHFYLPLFFEGLTEIAYPYETFACQGIHDLLDHGGTKILPVIPQLIFPIRNAMNTRNHRVMCNTLKVLQHLVMSADGIGEALVPYFRQILPVFNIFKNKTRNVGDEFDDSSLKGGSVGHLINETLQMLERHGGKDAYRNIKYMIPIYESCMK